MSTILSIKDKLGTFSIEIGSKNYMFPSLSLTVNKVEPMSFNDMVDIVIEHTLRIFELNNHKVNKFCINTGFARNCYIYVTFESYDVNIGDNVIKDYDIMCNLDYYKLALFYVIFMIAYFIDDKMEITKDESDTFTTVKECIKEGKLITGG